MADFADGISVLIMLAENDWYGITSREIANKHKWDYQKALRVLRDVSAEGLIHAQPNGAWRLSEDFLGLLVTAQASFLDRLNTLTTAPAVQIKSTDDADFAENKKQSMPSAESVEEK